MVQPNSTAAAFCAYLVGSGLRFSPARLLIINHVWQAAQSHFQITNKEWLQFIQITAFAYDYYVIDSTMS